MGPPAEAIDRQSPVVTALWWLLTFLTLVVLDDLTFGPAFWLVARVAGMWVAVVAVLAIYVPAQLWLVWRGTSPDAGRVARWLLRRFDVNRRHEQIEQRSLRLRAEVVGVSSSIVLSIVIGGVLPPMLLWRQGWPRGIVLRVAMATSVVYALEFAVLHAVIPASI